MERVKKRWDAINPGTGLTKQKLRDNAPRFKKGKKLLNLILVRKRQLVNNANAQWQENNQENKTDIYPQHQNVHYTNEEVNIYEMEEVDQDF